MYKCFSLQTELAIITECFNRYNSCINQTFIRDIAIIEISTAIIYETNQASNIHNIRFYSISIQTILPWTVAVSDKLGCRRCSTEQLVLST